MAHLSLYRKYRSQSFSELVGQDHVVKTLQNAISSGRVAHAYLFTGPRGTGKTSTARLLAKCLCAEGGPSATPDPESEISQLIAQGACVDVVEMDAASESGVDDIRTAIIEAVEYKPMMCPYKVFIIDEVHDLSAKAFDALLKTIEEPPPHVVFILATTEYNKVPATVRSRCQKYEFHRASMADLIGRLSFVGQSEGITIEPAALTAIARIADGGYRDALTLLEQVMLTTDSGVTLAHVQDQLGLVNEEAIDRLLTGIAGGDVAAIIQVLGEVERTGRDPRSVLESLLYRLADLTRASFGIDVGDAQDATREASLHASAAAIGQAKLLQIRAEAADAFRAIRDISLPRLWLESRLIAMATAPVVAAQAKPAQAKPAQTHAAQPQAAASSKSQPESTPTATAANQIPEAIVTEDLPAVPAAPPVIPSGLTPEHAAAFLLWHRMNSELPDNVVHRMRLVDSVVEEVTGQTMFIGIANRMSLDWFTDKPQRLGYIASQLKALSGEDWKIELRLAKKKTVGGP